MDLSVILVSFNTKEITEKCLLKVKEAVRFSEKRLNNKVEVIVVDNNSSDDSPAMITRKFPFVNLIQSGENLGFGRGNNLGMNHSRNPLILLLNTDCYIKEDTFVNAVRFFETYGSCDVLGCTLKFKNGGFQPSAGFLPNRLNTAFWMLGLDNAPLLRHLVDTVHERDRDFFRKTRVVEWVQGAFFMMRREVFEKTGGFDEKLFMYMEEVEWCFRIKKHGFKVFFTPDFDVIHLGGASSGYQIGVPLFKEMEGLIYLFRKYYPDSIAYLKLMIALGCFLRIAAFGLLGRLDRVRAYLKVLKFIF